MEFSFFFQISFFLLGNAFCKKLQPRTRSLTARASQSIPSWRTCRQTLSTALMICLRSPLRRAPKRRDWPYEFHSRYSFIPWKNFPRWSSLTFFSTLGYHCKGCNVSLNKHLLNLLSQRVMDDLKRKGDDMDRVADLSQDLQNLLSVRRHQIKTVCKVLPNRDTICPFDQGSLWWHCAQAVK